jgi:hypothetical protein
VSGEIGKHKIKEKKKLRSEKKTSSKMVASGGRKGGKEKKKNVNGFECKFIYQLKIHTDLLEQLSGVEFVFCHLMC